MRTTARQLAATLYDLTAKQKDDEIKKTISCFVAYLAKQKRLKDAQKIIENFEEIYNEKNGIIDAQIVSAIKLEAKSLKNIKDFVKKKYQVKEVILRVSIDEKIKGGIILKVRDEVIDGSLKGRLSALKGVLTRN